MLRREQDGIGLKIQALLQKRWRKTTLRKVVVQRWLLMVCPLIISLIVAAKQMLTEEIFYDPNVRKHFRELLLGGKSGPSRAGYSVKPTERGLKKIDDGHPYYVCFH